MIKFYSIKKSDKLIEKKIFHSIKKVINKRIKQNDIIFIYDIPKNDEGLLKKLYVGLSRARYKLYVFVDLSDKDYVQKFAKKVR